MIIYTAQSGDTLYSIARRYGLTLSELERYNGLPDSSRIAIGQDILIPSNNNTYIVRPGDSVYSIAVKEGVSTADILRENPSLTEPYTIYPGQVLLIPKDEANKKTIDVNGYCYPNINRDILRQTLPYLTFLSIFSYSALADGNLSGINDEELIRIAKEFRTAPVMVVTNTVEGSGFDSDLARTILTNSAVRSTLISNIVSTARSKGYSGVDIDFEYIYPSNRTDYNNFLTELKAALTPYNLSLSTAIAPKLSATQVGTLYEAHDYAFHGKVADRVIIMTYEWGYLYGPPLAVAPYSEVKKVISYAVTEMPSEKILMGMPNYGYDWTLPYREGTAADILSINSAMLRAVNENADIEYNESSEAPFFEYTKDGQNHIVWFENARSTMARLELINDYNLGGVSYWTIGSLFTQNWRVIDSMFNIRKL